MRFDFPTYSKETAFEGKETSYFKHCRVNLNEPRRLENNRWMFRVDVRGVWHDTSKPDYVSNLKFEFSEKADLTTERARKLMVILGVFAGQFVNLYTTQDKGDRLTLYADSFFKEQFIDIPSDLFDFAADLNWQSKVGGFTQGFSPNIKTRPKTDTLPQCHYPEYKIEVPALQPWTWPTSNHPHNAQASLEDYAPSDVALCASFGKEMLLTWSILKETYGGEVNQVKLCSNEDYDLPFYKVFKELAVELENLEGMKLDFRQTRYNVQSDHERLNNKPKELYFYLHILAVMFCIETDCRLILWGSEHERSYVDDVLVNGVLHPLYTYDYDQSQWLAAKLNKVFEAYGLDIKMGSVLSNITEIQVQWLLWKREPHLLPIQYSCIEATPGRQWCCECTKCKLMLTWIKMMGIPYDSFPTLKLSEYDKNEADGRQPIFTGMANVPYPQCVDGWLCIGDNHPIKQEIGAYWMRPYADKLRSEIACLQSHGMLGEEKTKKEVEKREKLLALMPKFTGPMYKMRELWPDWPCQVLSLTKPVKKSIEKDLATMPFFWME
jgi:hypothetical protein